MSSLQSDIEHTPEFQRIVRACRSRQAEYADTGNVKILGEYWGFLMSLVYLTDESVAKYYVTRKLDEKN